MSKHSIPKYRGESAPLWMLNSSIEGLRESYHKGIDSYLRILTDITDLYDSIQSMKAEKFDLLYRKSYMEKHVQSAENRMMCFMIDHKAKQHRMQPKFIMNKMIDRTNENN